MSWGISNFENDSALEWAEDLVKANKVALIAKELDTFNKNFKITETDMMTCNVALAAAETVAAIKEDPADDIPEALEEWLASSKAKADETLVKSAIDAVNKICRGSELKEMYVGSQLYDDWLELQKELLQRLKRG